jgi:FixJ family two-component response regulator
LQRKLTAAGDRIPIVFITAHDDDSIRHAAMVAGAIGFLQKPFEDQALVALVSQAVGPA